MSLWPILLDTLWMSNLEGQFHSQTWIWKWMTINKSRLYSLWGISIMTQYCYTLMVISKTLYKVPRLLTYYKWIERRRDREWSDPCSWTDNYTNYYTFWALRGLQRSSLYFVSLRGTWDSRFSLTTTAAHTFVYCWPRGSINIKLIKILLGRRSEVRNVSERAANPNIYSIAERQLVYTWQPRLVERSFWFGLRRCFWTWLFLMSTAHPKIQCNAFWWTFRARTVLVYRSKIC